MLSESAARWLLVLHTGLGVAAVGAATHLFLWLRRYVRGEQGRRRAVVRFAVLTLVLQGGAFVCGNVMYPTYKVEVRTAFLENATAVGAQVSTHERTLARGHLREGQPPPVGEETVALVRRAARAAHYFDVKEHWIALGVFAQAALLLILALWDPHRDGHAIAPIVVGLAGIAAATVWLGAIIGVLTASLRAI